MRKLTVDEFVIVSMNVNPKKLKYDSTGRVKNFGGYAFQLQRLLYKKIKIIKTGQRLSYAKMGEYECQFNTSEVTKENAEFEVGEYLDVVGDLDFLSNKVESEGLGVCWNRYWRMLQIYLIDYDDIVRYSKYLRSYFLIFFFVFLLLAFPKFEKFGYEISWDVEGAKGLLFNDGIVSVLLAVFLLSLMVSYLMVGARYLWSTSVSIIRSYVAKNIEREDDDLDYDVMGQIVFARIVEKKDESGEGWINLLHEIGNKKYKKAPSDCIHETCWKLQQELNGVKDENVNLKESLSAKDEENSRLNNRIGELERLENDNRKVAVHLPLALLSISMHSTGLGQDELLRDIEYRAKEKDIKGLSYSSTSTKVATWKSLAKATNFSIEAFKYDIKQYK